MYVKHRLTPRQSRTFHLFAFVAAGCGGGKEQTLLAAAGTVRSMKNEKSLTYVYAPLSSSFMTYLLNHAQTIHSTKANKREGERGSNMGTVRPYRTIIYQM